MAFEELVTSIIELIRSSGPWGVIIGVIIESVLAPIPSPLIIMAAGFLLLPAGVSFLEVLVPLLLIIVIPGALASTFGSFLGYAIGYYGGKPLIKKFNWLLDISWDELEDGVNKFGKGKKDELIIFSARALPIIPLSVFSGVAGVLRLNIKTFTLYTLLGTLVRVFILGVLGWVVGSAYAEIASGIEFMEQVGLFALLTTIAIVLYLFYKKVKAKRKKQKK